MPPSGALSDCVSFLVLSCFLFCWWCTSKVDIVLWLLHVLCFGFRPGAHPVDLCMVVGLGGSFSWLWWGWTSYTRSLQRGKRHRPNCRNSRHHVGIKGTALSAYQGMSLKDASLQCNIMSLRNRVPKGEGQCHKYRNFQAPEMWRQSIALYTWY